MATSKIKTGDIVKVISGSEKGKEGKVLSVNTKNGTVTVEGVNMKKKHAKPSKQHQEGGIISFEGPINISNVMYVHKGKPTRIGFTIKDGKKLRYAKSEKITIE